MNWTFLGIIVILGLAAAIVFWWQRRSHQDEVGDLVKAREIAEKELSDVLKERTESRAKDAAAAMDKDATLRLLNDLTNSPGNPRRWN